MSATSARTSPPGSGSASFGARAVRAAALLVLDEPNANLDQEGEAALPQALTTMKGRGAAILLVTHRSHVLRDADRMALLRDGALQAFGPRDAVLAPLQQPRPLPASAGGAAVQQVAHIYVSPEAKRATR